MKKKTEDTYYLFAEYHTEKYHAKVWKPILTEEEQERRMKRLKEAAGKLLMEHYATEWAKKKNA